LEFAALQLQPNGTVTQSNETGRFRFEGLCPGTYSLLVQHLGCKDSVFVFTLEHDTQRRFSLPHRYNEINAVDVVTEHEEAKRTENTQSLSQKDLDKTMGQSLGEQLKQLNGVTSLNTGPTISKPMINGMQGYRILILNNGVRQEGQQWGNEHAPEIDPFVANSISVIRGAASVRYGSDAIGGVVLVQPATMPSTEKINGEAQISGFSNGRGGAAALQLQGYSERLKNFSWRIQGSMKQNGSIKTPNYFLKNTAAQERNISATLDYHGKQFGLNAYYAHYQSQIGIFSGSHIGNLTDLYAAFNSAKPQDSLASFSYEIGRPYQNITHDLLKLSGDLHTGKRSRIRALYSYQDNHRQEYDKNLPRNVLLAAKNLPEADYRLQSHGAELLWEHEYIKGFRGMVGFQANLQTNRYQQRFFIPNYDSKALGVFAMERFVRRRFELEAGLRADYKHLQSYFYDAGNLLTPQRNFQNISYKLGLIIKPIQGLLVTVNAGNGWRSPSANELYSNGLHHGVGAIERGDANLAMEKCLNFIAGAVYKVNRLDIEGTAYHYAFSNYIYYYPGSGAELTVRGAFPVFYYAQCKADLTGADLQVKYKLNSRVGIKLRGMYLRGTNKNTHEPLIYMPANRIEASTTFYFRDRTHFSDLTLEPAIIAVAKQNRVPSNVDFVPPPNAYVLFGFNGGCTIKIKQGVYYINFSVTNLFNTVYRDYLDRFRYYNDAAGSNYNLKLRIPFTIHEKKIINHEEPIEITPKQTQL
jgi:iron complex outermembrane receptor protein